MAQAVDDGNGKDDNASLSLLYKASNPYSSKESTFRLEAVGGQ